MKAIAHIDLEDVKAVYNGQEGDLWELLMGEQIHIGGFKSSMDLSERAQIHAGMRGVDLCCCNGAGMRFLVRFRDVAAVTGVDASAAVVERGRRRCTEEGFDERIRFVLGDACDSGLPSASADFVWGEDAWCYVPDKPQLIAEAARLVRPGGTIAFTDWIEGPTGLSDAEAVQFLTAMRFANVQDIPGYTQLLRDNGCTVLVAEDTGRFAAHIELYLQMVELQLTYDALKIIGFNRDMMQAVTDGLAFIRDLARAGKIVQGRFIAHRAT